VESLPSSCWNMTSSSPWPSCGGQGSPPAASPAGRRSDPPA